MDAENWPRIRELFERALDVPSDERPSFIERESNDEGVRREVLRLLGGTSTGFDVLTPPAASAWREHFTPWHPLPGDHVGSFVIQRTLASGGMGTVYEARQERPARLVALKMMHSVLFSDDARRRFEVEAEILARLRHPGIATIHELGAHRGPDGSEAPFFAMEFIEGARDLVTFAREHELDLRARIELFREVCAAVQYAHQKGVIHRDLKPGNVLVDAAGRPKVIDYGVARVVEPGFADGVQTRAGEVLGTLQYMSPEQLEGSSADVDTRSDVYSLGVILYELVAGRPPHELAHRPIAEIIAAICTRTPPPPSTHVPTLAREIDWIVLRALAKERDRRYASAAELSADLARYLRNEPVLAGPPTRRYRATKFVARNRVLVAVASAAVLSLVVGLVVALRARAQAADDAEKARVALRQQEATVNAMLRMFNSVSPVADGRSVTLSQVLEKERGSLDQHFKEDPGLRARMKSHLGAAYDALGLHEEGDQLLSEAIEEMAAASDADQAQLAWLRVMSAKARIQQGRLEEARRLFDLALPELERAGELQTEHGMKTRQIHADYLEKTGNRIGAMKELREVVALSERFLGPMHEETIHLQGDLARDLATFRRCDDAVQLARTAHERSLMSVAPEHPQALFTGMILADVLRDCRKFDESEELLRALVANATAVYGERHQNLLHANESLAWTLAKAGKVDEAEEFARHALDLVEQYHGGDATSTAWARKCLADVFEARGDWQARRDELARAVEGVEEVAGSEHPAWFDISCQLIWADFRLGRFDEAEQRARAMIEWGHAHPRIKGLALAQMRGQLGLVLAARGDEAQARPELQACLDAYDALDASVLAVLSDDMFAILREVCSRLSRPEVQERFESVRTSWYVVPEVKAER